MHVSGMASITEMVGVRVKNGKIGATAGVGSNVGTDSAGISSGTDKVGAIVQKGVIGISAGVGCSVETGAGVGFCVVGCSVKTGAGVGFCVVVGAAMFVGASRASRKSH